MIFILLRSDRDLEKSLHDGILHCQCAADFSQHIDCVTKKIPLIISPLQSFNKATLGIFFTSLGKRQYRNTEFPEHSVPFTARHSIKS